MDELAKLKMMIGEEADSKDELLAILLEDAMLFLLAYTGRDKWLPVFDAFAREIALVAYSRLGDEAVVAKKEGDVSARYVEAGDLPRRVLRAVNRYRVIS
jgi:hypothetical protein